MAQEIERKFLVDPDGAWRREAVRSYRIRQGFITTDERATVRVRTTDDAGFLTVKGASRGAVRDEYEYAIPVDDAERMLDSLCGDLVEKTRYVVLHDAVVWEVDEFSGANDGLIVAEVELHDPDQAVTLPPWVRAEVTDDPRYFNANLSRRPFRTWNSA